MPEKYTRDFKLIEPAMIGGSAQPNVVNGLATAAVCACDRSDKIAKNEAFAKMLNCRQETHMVEETTEEAGSDLFAFAKGSVSKDAIKQTLESPAKANPAVLRLMETIGIRDLRHTLSNDPSNRADGIGAITAIRYIIRSFKNKEMDKRAKDVFIRFYTTILLARYAQSLACTERGMVLSGRITGLDVTSNLYHALLRIGDLVEQIRPEAPHDFKSWLDEFRNIRGTKSVAATGVATKGCRAMCEYAVKGVTGSAGTCFSCKRYDEMLSELFTEFALDAMHAYARQQPHKGDVPIYTDMDKVLENEKISVVANALRDLFRYPDRVAMSSKLFAYLPFIVRMRISDMSNVMSTRDEHGTPIVALHRVMHDVWELPPEQYPARDAILHVYILALLGKYRKMLVEMHKVLTLADMGKLDGTTRVGGKLLIARDKIDAEIERFETVLADKVVADLGAKATLLASGKSRATAAA